MSVSRIAKRYAKPLLELASEQNILENVKDDMEQFSNICRDNKEFLLLLKSPIITHIKKEEILKKIFQGKVNELTMSIFSIMARKNREAVLPDVAEQFVTLYREKMGIQRASVTTTFTLDSKLKKSFEKVVSDISGKKPELKEEIDESILGGFILKLDDRQIDESIKGQLKELSLNFKKERN